jgi:hypothetical protein
MSGLMDSPMTGLRWALVCSPDDPAAAAWAVAAATAGAPAPRLVPWADVLDGTAKFDDGELVHAERLTPTVPLRYGGSRARYERFAAAPDLLQAQLAADGATATAEAAAVLVALDRQRCNEHLAAAGALVPTAGDTVVADSPASTSAAGAARSTRTTSASAPPRGNA